MKVMKINKIDMDAYDLLYVKITERIKIYPQKHSKEDYTMFYEITSNIKDKHAVL